MYDRNGLSMFTLLLQLEKSTLAPNRSRELTRRLSLDGRQQTSIHQATTDRCLRSVPCTGQERLVDILPAVAWPYFSLDVQRGCCGHRRWLPLAGVGWHDSTGWCGSGLLSPTHSTAWCACWPGLILRHYDGVLSPPVGGDATGQRLVPSLLR